MWATQTCRVTWAELHVQLLQHCVHSVEKSYIKGSNCKHNRFATHSQETMHIHLGFDIDNTELHSARAEYQIVSIDTTQASIWYCFLQHHFTTVISNWDCNTNNCAIITRNNIANKNPNVNGFPRFWGILKGHPCNVYMYQALFSATVFPSVTSM